MRGVLSVAPFLVCLAWSTEPRTWTKTLRITSLFSACLFAASCWVPQVAAWGCVPWFAVGCLLAFTNLSRAWSQSSFQAAPICRLAASVYLPVGAVWAFFDQIGFQPLGFSGVIVLLTGVHFHYAGFALPWLTSKLAASPGNKLSPLSVWGVILGVPLVAVGITGTQLNLPNWVETAAVTILSGAALAVSYETLRFAGQQTGATKILFTLSGCALAGGMALALLYGWRPFLSLSWVTIPVMYTLHGTLNSWGFCLPGILGWKVRRP